mmetsp:Transcript_100521/g.138587  ORF Transcript_100521/g.138587 Transcript_100521/m.138587 type:complete len:107 (+) Transcript_100521:2428-2748(+)
MDGSLNDLIVNLLIQGPEREPEVKNIKKQLNLNEKVYFTIVIKAYVQAEQWVEVAKFIDMKKPPCPHASIGEICYSYSEKKQGGSTIALEHAVRAMQKVSDADERI